ncbi:MAG: DUF3313 family protein [Halioglobus sp.]
MNGKLTRSGTSLTTYIAMCLLLLFSVSAVAKDKLPETSHDGLKLQNDTKLAAVYLKPGESLEGYDKVTILDVYVAFKKNWQRNYNQDTMGLDGRVNDKDIVVIKKRLAGEFKTIFSRELQKKGGYEVVADAGQGVLLLRPAIVNLVVNAPDVNRAGMGRNFVASAGEMTLYLELFDSVSGDIIARVMDAQAAGNHGIAHMGGQVGNKAEFDRVLAGWADTLRKHLDSLNTGK